MAIKEKKTKRSSRKIIIVAVDVLVIIGLALFGGYFFKKYQDLKNNPITPQQAQQVEQDRITSAVSKLYALPKDEQPQLIFVKDKTKLTDEQKNQALFQKATNGDYLLVYVKNRLAILYRPSENRIVDVRTVNIQSGATVKIIGTDADRAVVKKTLTEAYPNDVSVKDESVAKATYTGVTVVDLTGNNAALASKLATGLKGTVGTLPAGEDKPAGVEILVIAGAPATTPAP